MDLSEVTGRNRGIDSILDNPGENNGRHLRPDYMSGRGSSSYGEDRDSISHGRAGVLMPGRGSSHKEGSYATSMQNVGLNIRPMQIDKNNSSVAVYELVNSFGGTLKYAPAYKN